MKKIDIGELLVWFKRYERYVEGDPIDSVQWREEFLEFIMYLVNNLDEGDNQSVSQPEGCKHIWKKQNYGHVVITHHSEGIMDKPEGYIAEGTLWEYCEKCGERRSPEVENNTEDEELKHLILQRETFYRRNEDDSFSQVDLINEFYEDIEQLLSERSFSKEELKRIRKRVNEYDKDRYEDGIDCRIVEKVDRLLSLNGDQNEKHS